MLNLNFKIMKKVFLFLGATLLALGVNAETVTDYASADVYAESTEGKGENADGLWVWENIGWVEMAFAANDAMRFTFTGVTERTAKSYAFQVQTSNGNAQMVTTSPASEGYVFEIELADYYEEGAIVKGIGIMNTDVIQGDGTPVSVKAELISDRAASDPSFTLAYNAGGSNYQAEVPAKLSEIPASGSVVKWTIAGYADKAVSDIQIQLVSKAETDGWWKVMSNASEVTLSTSGEENTIAETVVTLTVNDAELSAETKASDLVFVVYSGTATEVTKVYYTKFEVAIEGGEGGEPTAVESVSADAFAVVGGMVYSAGEITVYNVAGKAIATASQSFNVNSLEAGVYFISAQEGTIKFVK